MSLDGDGLRKVARHIDITPFAHSYVIGKQLQGY